MGKNLLVSKISSSFLFQKVSLLREVNGKSQKFSSFGKMAEKYGSVTVHRK